MLMLALVGREADGDARLLPLHVAFPITDDGNHVAREKRLTNLGAAPAKRGVDT